MKKNTTISIDENVLRIAKKEITNISVFVEDCFRAYLGLDGDDLLVGNVQNELDKIRQAKLNIHILTKTDEPVSVVQQDILLEQQVLVWKNIWRHYRVYEEVEPKDLQQASKYFGLATDELLEMLNKLLLYSDNDTILLLEDWSFAKSKYDELKQE